MSRQVKEIRKQLDDIVSNHQKFGFNVDYKPICRRREETCSYVDVEDIIGRENDEKIVIDMLLGLNSVLGDSRFVTIVGVGGLGKTALAQLVYNSEKVIKEFSKTALRLWVCVSDQDGELFDVREILCKILELVSGTKPDSTSSLEWVQNQLQQKLGEKKYFLVLDDVWNEDFKKWQNLRRFLMLGQRGSRILITTRSERTAEIIGDKYTYKLEGLSPENSWFLFEKTAFVKGKEDRNNLELAKIGKNIVEKCYNIPLAIKVVGSLLFGQSITKWKSFEEKGLTEIDSGHNKIMSILQLSYHNLNFSLKSCFRYCALYPKDTRIERETLISLWMAQGYIVPFDRCQSIEDTAEEYFSVLIRRCFFQDVLRDDYGDVESVKVHDLMHDVAQDVGRVEICVLGSLTNKFEDKIRHVHSTGYTSENFIFKNKIRSFICKGVEEPWVNVHIDNWMCLRVLCLERYSNIKSLPDSIGKLLHLRYLNLGENRYLKTLPDSITKLHNLQTLNLSECSSLRELPKDFSKLVNIRHLNLSGCVCLSSMPSDMDKLTSLSVLPYFVVGCREEGTGKQCDGGLKYLKGFTNIKGYILISLRKNYRNVEVNDREEGYLKRLEHLKGVHIKFDIRHVIDDRAYVDYEGIEKFQPPSNIEVFILSCYFMGRTIPMWGRAMDNWANSFPHLVKIKLYCCYELEQIPSLSKLPFLKSLELFYLYKLEYMENRSSNTSSDIEEDLLTTFFPSLEVLSIYGLRSMKGWWRREGLVEDDDGILRLRFPCLSKLYINRCPELTSFPSCPNLEDLFLYDCNEKLQFGVNIRDKEDDTVAGISHDAVGRLQTLFTDKVEHLKSIFSNDKLSISGDDAINWNSINQSLHILQFESLENSHLPLAENVVQYLTSLQRLEFSQCKYLKALPEWIGNILSLQYMCISFCPALESLPDSMRKLTSLQTLVIEGSQGLSERCREPNGEDWPKIQHIPHKDIPSLTTPMAELGILIVGKLIEVIGSSVIKEICDMWGYKSQLQDLNKTLSTIKNVLLDAESQRELSHEARAYIEELKAAVYDADDLFDELFTLAELKQLQPLSKRGKLFDKVRCFFSSKNQAGLAYRMSRQVKDIRKQLDDIVNNHQKFGFSIDNKPICNRRNETWSYVEARDIIGREDDKNAVIDMLIGPENISAITNNTGDKISRVHDSRIFSDSEWPYMLDLMNGVSKEVGLEEICIQSFIMNNLGEDIRHVHYGGNRYPESFFLKSKIRTFICRARVEVLVDKQIDNWVCLRALELQFSSIESLPNSIGKLIHLRYLDLSYARLEMLPDSITELHNLQTLSLHYCSSLRELPKKFSKLLKLRHLNLRGCNKLTSMPSGMDKLTSLRVLPFFVVGKGSENPSDDELENLKALTNIQGEIHITFGNNYRRNVEGEYLKSTKHLMEVTMQFDNGGQDLMGNLKPHSNLKRFILEGYNGTTIPRWGRGEDKWDISFPHLVKIQLYACIKLEQMPSLCKLPFLKSLQLSYLLNLEYMENTLTGNDDEDLTTFFPSLEFLELECLLEFKGWFVDDDDYMLSRRLRFPRLSKLVISDCDNLTSFPACPSIEDLELHTDNEIVGISQDGVRKLRKLVINKVAYFKLLSGNDQLSITDDSIPWKSINQSLRSLGFLLLKDREMPVTANGVQYLTSLQELNFSECRDIEALPDWISNLSSLESLFIKNCKALESLPGSLQNLTNLQRLEIVGCPDLEERYIQHNGEDWPKIQHIPHVYFS
ncbi:putative disease resistance protein RGA3 [Spinacia oleracea]|uniref:Disease resistance protein RGA3 n=1 Tax=Spinacia oleracea TaxID=3562 RepID=A0A9R0ICP4_SPIOL|nr:putative disease resistance protein RGA3 [Spinacia oleracea]XP_021846912.1 putative disease resistance protein RGA3 [Spinacia oleracea]XP_056698874.1 putative disease resistance protein RGA3 [Spinacia oleracea]XP_056698875.1 putative disease resistance protein RGA3 [Spinacia oleracea]XP_056698876.1 putative disease resistance protein RGA3 [Spinacia oleracea]